MPEENAPNSITGPMPVKNPTGSSAFTRVVAVTAATVGGFLIFAPMLAPTCVKGATRSAKLKWEERQREIQTAINDAALRGDLPQSITSEKTPADTSADDGTASPN